MYKLLLFFQLFSIVSGIAYLQLILLLIFHDYFETNWKALFALFKPIAATSIAIWLTLYPFI